MFSHLVPVLLLPPEPLDLVVNPESVLPHPVIDLLTQRLLAITPAHYGAIQVYRAVHIVIISVQGNTDVQSKLLQYSMYR